MHGFYKINKYLAFVLHIYYFAEDFINEGTLHHYHLRRFEIKLKHQFNLHQVKMWKQHLCREIILRFIHFFIFITLFGCNRVRFFTTLFIFETRVWIMRTKRIVKQNQELCYNILFKRCLINNENEAIYDTKPRVIV